MSPENPKNPETSRTHEETMEFCSRINECIDKARQLRNSPHDEELVAELAQLSGGLIKESFHGEYHFRLIIPEGADARETTSYTNFINLSPRVFIADRVNRIDITQADFYDHRDDDEPAVHLTSFDFDLRAEPLI